MATSATSRKNDRNMLSSVVKPLFDLPQVFYSMSKEPTSYTLIVPGPNSVHHKRVAGIVGVKSVGNHYFSNFSQNLFCITSCQAAVACRGG
jgi:hypothetical protein